MTSLKMLIRCVAVTLIGFQISSDAYAVDQQYANQEDLCNLCDCNYPKAVCDFQQHKTLSSDWDSKYRLPNYIKSIKVYLKANLKFRLHESFFQNNTVNYFGITGALNNDLVEITRNAFSRNNGGYPNIEFLKIAQVFVQERGFSGNEYKVLFQDIGLLVVYPNAFTMTNLDCTFNSIGFIRIPERAFSHGGSQNHINVRFINSTIEELVRFDLSMSHVVFDQCTIGRIARNAFDVTKISELLFVKCNINTIEAYALTNKLNSENVSFVETDIGTIEGKAISRSGITSLTFRGNTIDHIKSEAIQPETVEVFIRNNTVKRLESKWLHAPQVSLVVIVDNHFGFFSDFEVKSDPKSTFNCSFAHNQLDDPQPGSLNISQCDVYRIRVGRKCSCDGKSWLKTLTDHDLDSEILCPLIAEEHSCFNATTVDRRRYEHEACGGNETRYCSDGKWITQSEHERLRRSDDFLSWKWICISVGVFVLCVVIFLWVFCRSRGGGGQATATMCSFSDDNKAQLIESMDKLSEHDQTRKAIDKLIKGSNTKDECLTRICQIIEHLPHKSSPVKDLLTNHLNECHESGSPMSSSGSVDYGEPAIGGNIHNNTNEHIYQELDQQQRPLIPSEYSEPPPLAEVTYSEPFNATSSNDMPPAYQYATPTVRHPRPQPPSAATACYASPVWRSTPSAPPTSRPPSGVEEAMPAPRHVRDLRQDLEAMPQFHPNQLTSARNQRQLQQNFPQPPPQPQPLPHPQPPPYSQPDIRRHRSRQSFECLDGAASLAAMEHMDSGSDHSGGSDVTVQIADVIDYADA